ncbi:rhodanese-like domain-containing protein [Chitinilyticum aquatile]|uniref:rhodanese-like domain-containing protein n=1 Tax=Chitinilyticum aquatile TaxID=362520 RepID=UPI000425172B|nr:rhodanese-like domain-containing protein [Chitinilyticum aquatile]
MQKFLLALFLSGLAGFALATEGWLYQGSKPAAIIDVRSVDEFAAGHIEGAINIPVEQIASGLQHIRSLNKDSTILLYCRSGRRAAAAQQLLEQQGYRKVVNGGGMDELKAQLAHPAGAD